MQLRKVFDRFLDPAENLRHRKFTMLHKSVLGSSTIPLIAQLQISTADIDAQCSIGGTALSWAIRRDDIIAVKTLLRFGADIHLANIRSQNPIGISCRYSPKSLELLLEVLVAIDLAKDSKSYTKESSAIDRQPSKLGLPSPATSGLKLAVDQKDKDNYTALHKACQWAQTPGEAVTILLDYSADVNACCHESENPRASRSLRNSE